MSGYEGFLTDSFTRLPATRERIAATSVAASWRYSGPCDYDASFAKGLAALGAAFFGPASGGTYSPSLQFTLFEMGKGLLEAVPSAESVHLKLPNLHFLPCAPVNSSVRFVLFFFALFFLPRNKTRNQTFKKQKKLLKKQFDDDVYVATSEPHGTIEATVTRGCKTEPHVKLWASSLSSKL